MVYSIVALEDSFSFILIFNKSTNLQSLLLSLSLAIKCQSPKVADGTDRLFLQSINRIRGMLKGEAHSRYPDVFVAGLKSVIDGTLKTVQASYMKLQNFILTAPHSWLVYARLSLYAHVHSIQNLL